MERCVDRPRGAGAIALIALIGMLLMRGTMMGGKTNCCGAMVRVWLIALLSIAVIVAAAIMLSRRRLHHQM